MPDSSFSRKRLTDRLRGLGLFGLADDAEDEEGQAVDVIQLRAMHTSTAPPFSPDPDIVGTIGHDAMDTSPRKHG